MMGKILIGEDEMVPSSGYKRGLYDNEGFMDNRSKYFYVGHL